MESAVRRCKGAAGTPGDHGLTWAGACRWAPGDNADLGVPGGDCARHDERAPAVTAAGVAGGRAVVCTAHG